MPKLVALLQDSIAPTKNKRKGTSELGGQRIRFSQTPQILQGIHFATLYNCTRFASDLPVDQFPTLRDVKELDGQISMADSPTSLTFDMMDGNFVPQFQNSLAQIPLTNVQLVEQQGAKLQLRTLKLTLAM